MDISLDDYLELENDLRLTQFNLDETYKRLLVAKDTATLHKWWVLAVGDAIATGQRFLLLKLFELAEKQDLPWRSLQNVACMVPFMDPIYDTLLIHAIMAGEVNIAKFLLQQDGILVNQYNPHGITPMHALVQAEQNKILTPKQVQELFSALIKYGANPELMDKDGKKPADYISSANKFLGWMYTFGHDSTFLQQLKLWQQKQPVTIKVEPAPAVLAAKEQVLEQKLTHFYRNSV